MSQTHTGGQRASMLISAEELASEMREPGLVRVDCRFNLLKPEAGRAAWQAGHIPGAFHADLDRDLSGPRQPGTGRHPLPDAAQLQALFSHYGIGTDTPVVAYDEDGGALAARLWWLLRWMGHSRVRLLDGGLGAWRKAGLALATDAPVPGKGQFAGQPGHMPVRDAQAVAAGLAHGNITLIDVRAEDRFLGRVEPIDPVAGHIPGAVNAPFAGNLAADGRFQPGERLFRRYDGLAEGREPGQFVCMCGSGVTACHAIFALELAGMKGAALYPGSWSEWIRSPERPVSRAPATPRP